MLSAYIDPSSMTYLIQIIAGVVIAAGAGVGFYWKRIQRSLQKKKEAKAAEKSGDAVTQDPSEGEVFTAEMLHAQSGQSPEEK